MARHRYLILLVVLVLAVIAGAFWWQHRRAERAEAQLGLDASRMIDAAFEKASVLRVGRLSGTVVAPAYWGK